MNVTNVLSSQLDQLEFVDKSISHSPSGFDQLGKGAVKEAEKTAMRTCWVKLCNTDVQILNNALGGHFMDFFVILQILPYCLCSCCS